MRENQYETVYILRPDMTEEGAKKTHDKVSEVVGRSKGQVIAVKDLGKKQLAYPIARNTRGHYIQLDFRGTGQVVEDLERHLRLSEDVIRFLTVKKEKRQEVSP